MPRPVILIALMVGAVAIVIAHRIDAITMPQFYAEDGNQWFSNAYNIGPIPSLLLSHAGYLQVLSRLGPLIAAPFGISNQPLIFNICGLLTQVAPVAYLLSSRFDTVIPSLWVRVVLSAIYLLMPSDELNVTITTAPYHLVILATLVVIAPPPRRWWWAAFDVAAVLLCGLSGPFAYVLLPAALFWFVIRRRRFTLLLAAVLVVCFVAQYYASRFSPRPEVDVGASLENFVLIVCDRIILAGIFAEPGHRHAFVAGRPFGDLLAVVVCLLALPVVVFAALKAPWELRVFGLVATGIVAAGLLSPLVSFTANEWHLMATSETAGRYFFMARVEWVVIVVWTAAQLPRVWMTRTAWAAGAVAFASGFQTWAYTPFINFHWPQEARTIVTAAPGTRLLLPINPGNGWVIDVTVK